MQLQDRLDALHSRVPALRGVRAEGRAGTPLVEGAGGVTATWEVASATGHRTLTRKQQTWVLAELARVATKLSWEHGCTTAVSGMALNVDQTWARVAVAAQLRLWAVVPFPGQGDLWTPAEKQSWQEILREADKVIVVSEEDPRDRSEAAHMLHARNDKMLVVSDVVVAVWDPRRRQGGTWSAVRKAVRRELPIIWLNPMLETVTMPSPKRWQEILVMS
jgi:hypothetical protein